MGRDSDGDVMDEDEHKEFVNSLTKQKIKRILVEGPDCSGKSTLVERLKNRLHWDAKSLHHKPGDQFERYLKEYALADNIIFDRGHISEYVYSVLWRGGEPFKAWQYSILDHIIGDGGMIIFCNPSLALMKKRYAERTYPQQIKPCELEKSKHLFESYLRDWEPLTYSSSSPEALEGTIELVLMNLK
jgi:thymidylate kinase